MHLLLGLGLLCLVELVIEVVDGIIVLLPQLSDLSLTLHHLVFHVLAHLGNFSLTLLVQISLERERRQCKYIQVVNELTQRRTTFSVNQRRWILVRHETQTNLSLCNVASVIQLGTEVLEISVQVTPLFLHLDTGLSLSLKLTLQLFNASFQVLDLLLEGSYQGFLLFQFAAEVADFLVLPEEEIE